MGATDDDRKPFVLDLTLDDNHPTERSPPRKRRRRANDEEEDSKMPAKTHNTVDLTLDEDDDEIAADAAYARALQDEEFQSPHASSTHNNEADRLLAEKLQKKMFAQDKQKEDMAMDASITGKAWKFAERVLRLQQQVTMQESWGFQCVATDDMVFLAEKLFNLQANYQTLNKPFAVDIGYHYTRNENLENIRTVSFRTFSLSFQPWSSATIVFSFYRFSFDIQQFRTDF